MLRGLWAFCVLGFATLLCGVPSILVHLLRARSDFIMHAGRVWGRMCLAATGARVQYHDLEQANSRLPCIFICNHLSNVDIWAMMCSVPTSTRFVAKHSLFHIPVMGWAMTSAGFIPINRARREEAIRSLGHAAQRVRDGTSILLFAEGTRSRDGRLAPFKKGPFHLALQARVDLIPVAISGSWEVMRPGSIRVRPGPVHVRFMPAIDTTAYREDDLITLMADVRSAIVRGLDLASEAEPSVSYPKSCAYPAGPSRR